jgi:hypothetical protein
LIGTFATQIGTLPSEARESGSSAPAPNPTAHSCILTYQGWTPKAIGALAGCIITVILGCLTVVWYAWGDVDEADVEAELKRKQELKQASGGKLGFLKKKMMRAEVQ